MSSAGDLVAVCAAAGFMAWAVRGRSSASSAPPCGAGRATAAPWRSPSTTAPARARPQILEILARHSAPRHVLPVRRQRGAPARRGARRGRKPATTSATIATPIRCSAFARRASSKQDLRRAQEAIQDAHRRPARLVPRRPSASRWFGLRPGAAAAGTDRRHVDRNRL